MLLKNKNNNNPSCIILKAYFTNKRKTDTEHRIPTINRHNLGM